MEIILLLLLSLMGIVVGLAMAAIFVVVIGFVVISFISAQFSQSPTKPKKRLFRKDIETVLDTHTIITWSITFTLLFTFDLDLFVALGLSQLVALPYCFYRYQTKYRYLSN